MWWLQREETMHTTDRHIHIRHHIYQWTIWRFDDAAHLSLSLFFCMIWCDGSWVGGERVLRRNFTQERTTHMNYGILAVQNEVHNYVDDGNVCCSFLLLLIVSRTNEMIFSKIYLDLGKTNERECHSLADIIIRRNGKPNSSLCAHCSCFCVRHSLCAIASVVSSHRFLPTPETIHEMRSGKWIVVSRTLHGTAVPWITLYTVSTLVYHVRGGDVVACVSLHGKFQFFPMSIH